MTQSIDELGEKIEASAPPTQEERLEMISLDSGPYTQKPLDYWEEKKWMHPDNPYGWVHWYCDFYNGKRGEDDKRQIERWKSLAGPRGRFMRFLVSLIIKKNTSYDDESVSPKIRQVLQHWGYKLTKKDFEKELKRRNK